MLQLMGGYFINTCWSLPYVLIILNGVSAHRRLSYMNRTEQQSELLETCLKVSDFRTSQVLAYYGHIILHIINLIIIIFLLFFFFFLLSHRNIWVIFGDAWMEISEFFHPR